MEDLTGYFPLIWGRAVLRQEHRYELKLKRGFSDAIIDLLQFKSAGEYLGKQSPKEWPTAIKAPLWRDNILIPYFNEKGDLYHIRPHKDGFKDVGVQPYIPYPLLGEDTSHLVLAESEFKAAASCVMGVPAIGIPGITSHSRKNLPNLLRVLEALKCKKVTICFDNETKEQKSDWTKRYDTIIYEIIMASELNSKGYATKIARLKDEWRKDGKADIDGVLAQGVAHENYKECIFDALSPTEYRKTLKLLPVHKAYVDRKIDAHFYAGPIEEKDGFIFYKTKDDARIRIANFTMKIIHTLMNDNLAERFVKITSPYGMSHTRIITPDIMVSLPSFQRFLYEIGDYEFLGRPEMLHALWSYVMLKQDGQYVTKLKYYGYDKEAKVWFFENGAYRDGNFYEMGDNKIVWIDGNGFLLPDTLNEFDLPRLSDETEFDTGEPISGVENLLKMIETKMSNILEKNIAKMLLGWTLGNFFMPEILASFKGFPFLFFYGKWEEGKSTTSNWLAQFFGFTLKGVPFSSSEPGIRNAVNQLSMVPIWLEEYRNDNANIREKNSLLRSIYDRSSIIKATRTPGEIKTYLLRSSLIISGQEHPKDSALCSRCLLVALRVKKDKVNYEWMMRNASQFNVIGHWVLMNKNKFWPLIHARALEYIKAMDANLKEMGVRVKSSHALLGAICDVFFGEDQDFTDFIGTRAVVENVKINSYDSLSVFYDDILTMFMSQKIKFRFLQLVTMKSPNTGYSKDAVNFWFAGVFNEWELTYKKHREDIPASRAAMRDLLSREPYVIQAEASGRMDGKTMKVFKLDYEHPKFPKPLLEIIKIYQQEVRSSEVETWVPYPGEESNDDRNNTGGKEAPQRSGAAVKKQGWER